MNPSFHKVQSEQKKRGAALGITCVLFILIIIASRTIVPDFPKESRLDEGSISSAASRRFTIYNLTGDLTLEATTFLGQFASPVPSLPSSIAPGGLYSFVVGTTQGDNVAIARYKAVNSSGSTLGNIGMRMGVWDSGFALTPELSGSLTSYQESSTVYIYRQY
ncbi:hypothetical protein M3223_14740 [Paenibacillus pasadenensis]|uniref:hypothetical protein n=1 Tax=Paenibacillus pasadenensis TaxID=217090 RepID=UPI00203AA479|nr:hypothetical protein [Paenibacillus pasadenensis]MCM3748606.1 hypothetical protein [Paenibacillus pasadenensis]